ncbi:peptidase S1 and S6 chymotrypsin/Hap [Thermaerobacter marianensis DSM 12885]|uniref:Peptidase S1 and S6 chymotrypsin/Hap n=1 Tax=Thermaerobacter marianensis (strain ATCC 700841 / DSM 12885 / JCM 10246 / 7p75a) TaxID=644966 RepID=E6SLI0_THEM7|nr:trypsin-like peptidase domain-containing protein [Thermaerobacter marianensis]ADU52422.1 peptidase S1 and S6 chymotrypsin/Hap [Thermaerobacter marianensis DSM 12885]
MSRFREAALRAARWLARGWVLALLAGAAGGLVGAGAAAWLAKPGAVGPWTSPIAPPGTSSPAEAVQRIAGPSVVGVISTYLRRHPVTGGSVVAARATGAGVIIDARGFIVTNHHVVSTLVPAGTGGDEPGPGPGTGRERGGPGTGGAGDPPRVRDVHPQRIEVLLPGGRRVPARLVAEDYPYSDLAVLRVDPQVAGELKPARFADSDRVRVGQWVAAIGSPAGLFHSVSLGIVSGVREELFQPVPPPAAGAPVVGERIFRLIQTDAAINPGNSGGALVDARGRVIGINTVKIAGGGPQDHFEGLGFAIPANDVRRIASDLVRYGRVRRPALGVEVVDVVQVTALAREDPAWALQFATALSQGHGAVIWRVEPGSPAARAGLRRGQVVVGCDGEPVRDSVDLLRIIDGKAAGQPVVLAVAGDGGIRRVAVRLAELGR